MLQDDLDVNIKTIDVDILVEDVPAIDFDQSPDVMIVMTAPIGPQGVPGFVSLPADTQVPATVRILSNVTTPGDAQPAYRLFGDGKEEWGPGGSTPPDTTFYRNGPGDLKTDGDLEVKKNLFVAEDNTSKLYFGSNNDTSLYRAQADILKTDNNFWIAKAIYLGSSGDSWISRIGSRNIQSNTRLDLVLPSAGSTAFTIAADNDPNYPWFMDARGRMYWGPATTGWDTDLYRAAAGILKTDGQFYSSSYISAFQGTSNEVTLGQIGPSGQPGIRIGGDTNIFRTVLLGYQGVEVDWMLAAKADVFAQVGTVQQVELGAYGVAGRAGIYFGYPPDQYMYRGDTYFLAVNGRFRIDDNILYFGVAMDTSLSRVGANDLAASGQFGASWNLIAYKGSAQQTTIGAVGPPGLGYPSGISFGTANDVSLYRLAADVLKTDDALRIQQNFEGISTPLWLMNDPPSGAGQAGKGVELRMGGTANYYAAIKAIYDFSSPSFLNPSLRFFTMYNTYLPGTEVERLRIASDGQIWFNPSAGLDANLFRAGSWKLRSDAMLQLAGGQAAAFPGGLQVGDAGQLPMHYQGAIGGGVHGFIGHNIWFAQDGYFYWDATHPSFGSRGIFFNFGSGIDFYANAIATTAGAQATATLLMRVANNGSINFYGPAQGFADVYARISTAQQVWMGSDGAHAAIGFGSASDTTLYRESAGVIKTGGRIDASGGFYINGVAAAGSGPTRTISAFSGGPPASPADGDIWIADINGGYLTFVYRAAWSGDAYKWFFTGGTVMWTTGNISGSGSSGWGLICQIVPGRAGVYEARAQIAGTWGGGGAQAQSSLAFNGSIVQQQGYAGSEHASYAWLSALGAGLGIQAYGEISPGSWAYNGSLMVTPQRVI